MPNRHTDSKPTSPDEMFDLWLDALNDPTRSTPPKPPETIAESADIARRYHDAFGMKQVASSQRARVERNSTMNHLALSSTIPSDVQESGSPRHSSQRRASPGWLSGGLTTAVMVILLIMLVGGGLVQQFGWPGTGDGSPDRFSLMAPGTATPADGALACGSPNYRPIVEGDVNEETLAAIGIEEAPLQVDGDTLRIPTSTDEIVELPSTWTPLPGGSLWTDVQARRDYGTVTVLDVETGKEWTFPETGSFFPPVFHAPYLVVPASHAERDWRIIDTVTGEERLVSDIRGEPFPSRMRVSQLTFGAGPMNEADASALVFMPSYESRANQQAALEELGSNVLLIGESLDNATFLSETADVEYFHDSAYSPATSQLAYTTGTGHGINVLDLEPDDMIVIEDERFTDEVLPLMFSEDGSTLIADQPGTLFSISLEGDDAVVTTLYEDEPFVPIAYNTQTMTVVVKFADDHIAMIDASSGDVVNMPEVIEPRSEFGPPAPLFRLPERAQSYSLFDEDTSTVRFVNLITGTVSDGATVLNPEKNMISTPIQPGFQVVIPFPFVQWMGGYGYLDESETLHAISIDDDTEMFAVPTPEDLSVGPDQVVQLLVNPNENCLVLNVVNASDPDEIDPKREPGRVTTWIAPLAPGAEWTRLDIAITGWWEVYEAPEEIILPAPEVMTPIATPEG